MELKASRPWQRHQYHVWGPQAGKKFLLHISQLPLILSPVAMTARCSGFNGSDFVNIKLRHGGNISPVVRRSPSIRGENAALQDPLPHFSLCALVRMKETLIEANERAVIGGVLWQTSYFSITFDVILIKIISLHLAYPFNQEQKLHTICRAFKMYIFFSLLWWVFMLLYSDSWLKTNSV